MRRSLFGSAAALAAAIGLAGCSARADLGAADAERTKPLHRYDIVQSLAGNGQVVVGASQAGAVVVSHDQGKTWQREPLGPASIVGLAACPDGGFVGIDFHHKVWSAGRQGSGWKAVALEKPRTPLAVTCDAAGRWWVAGSGARISVSADRGATWTVTDLQEDAQLTTIQFPDPRHGIALGEFGHVVATEDGGATWKKAAQIPHDFYPYAAIFTDARTGHVAGLAGQTLMTRDGGRTWTPTENRAGAPLYRLFLHDGRPTGVGAGGVVARFDGQAWQPVAYPDAAPVFLGAGASTPAGLVIGGPGGLARPIVPGGQS